MNDKLATSAMLREELDALRPKPANEQTRAGTNAPKTENTAATATASNQITAPPQENIVAALAAANLGALCLSGGGIRSASFSLGAVQALAAMGDQAKAERASKPDDSLLARFDYLSTVSGGGYTGSFLSTWIARAGFDEVWAALTGRPGGPETEPKPLSWLRDYSSYLTPRRGIASADWWAAGVLVVRNLLLNWLVLLPILCLAILAVDGLSFWTSWLSKTPAIPLDNGLLDGFGIAMGVSMLIALRFATRNRPTRNKTSQAGTQQFIRFDCIWLVIAGLCFSFVLVLPSTYTLLRDLPNGHPLASLVGFFSFAKFGAAGGAALYALAWAIAWPHSRYRKDKFYDLLAWAVGGAVFGGILMTGAYAYTVIADGTIRWIPVPQFVPLIGGLPWIIFSRLAADMVFVGASSREEDSDDDREWLARAAGYYTVAGACWLLITASVVLGYTAATFAVGAVRTWIASTTVLSMLGTALLSMTKATPAVGSAKSKTGMSLNTILAIIAPLCAIGILVSASILLDWALFDDSLMSVALFRPHVEQDLSYPPWEPQYTTALYAAVFFVVLGLLSGYFININRFSLHAMYRNRIIRAFLGASHIAKQPTRNKFSGFDSNDNLNMHELWPDASCAADTPDPTVSKWVPFHVINIALNLVSSKKLAWQQRKAESFTVTPLHSGASNLGYRPSREYGDSDGITVGTAVAISGAAASPNMGYHSSPPLAFLMTWFNVRLGWWLGNPASDSACTKAGPTLAQVPLLQELVGYTTDERKFVYLSDGGHFENLGLYEMIRRRCQRIVVVDAGCDPAFDFEDLGNAVRKIAIDLGVRITFPDLKLMQCRCDSPQPPVLPAVTTRSWARATVHYQEADGTGADGEILYVKPTFYRDLIADVGVRNYGAANPDFPHQSTANQWFDESQFESYRALGFQIMREAIIQSKFDVVLLR